MGQALHDIAVEKQGQAFGPADLDACLDDRHFRVEYQPKVALLSNQLSQFGVEALCRVTSPMHGAISPDRFILIAEENNLIAKLTDVVTCEAFQAWRSWKSEGLCVRLALNVSPLLLGDEQWSRRLWQRCEEFSVDPKWITLEITETAAGATSAQACQILTRLQQKGFSLSIDDFGTGFSSLSTLYRLPIAEMKIDKSFIFDLQQRTGARDLVESAVAMAKRMGIKVVAEGVESESVFEDLRKIGCDEIQGFFVGKSMPADSIVRFFTDWRKSRGEEQGAAKSLPKAAMIQAILNDLTGDTMPVTAPASGPYARQAVAVAYGVHPSREVAGKIPPLVLGGKTLEALAHCHGLIGQLDRMASGAALAAKVRQLQGLLEEELLVDDDIEIRTPHRKFRLLPRDMVTMGRPTPQSKVDIPIKCRWFGPGGKSLRIFQKAGQYFIEDQGSIHGHFINGAKLSPHRPVKVPFGRVRVEVGQASGAVAPLMLVLQVNPADADAILIEFDYDSGSLRRELGEKEWGAMEDDLRCTWIVFAGAFTLGRSPDCALTLSDCTVPHAAAISFDKGFWITPADEAHLKTGAEVLRHRMPLMPNCELELSGLPLSIRDSGAPV